MITAVVTTEGGIRVGGLKRSRFFDSEINFAIWIEGHFNLSMFDAWVVVGHVKARGNLPTNLTMYISSNFEKETPVDTCDNKSDCCSIAEDAKDDGELLLFDKDSNEYPGIRAYVSNGGIKLIGGGNRYFHNEDGFKQWIQNKFKLVPNKAQIVVNEVWNADPLHVNLEDFIAKTFTQPSVEPCLPVPEEPGMDDALEFRVFMSWGEMEIESEYSISNVPSFFKRIASVFADFNK